MDKKKVCSLLAAKNAVALFFLIWVLFHPLIDVGSDGELRGALSIFTYSIDTILSFGNGSVTGIEALFPLVVVALFLVWIFTFILTVKRLIVSCKFLKNPESADAAKAKKAAKYAGVIALLVLYTLSYYGLFLAFFASLNAIFFLLVYFSGIAAVVLGALAKRGAKTAFPAAAESETAEENGNAAEEERANENDRGEE